MKKIENVKKTQEQPNIKDGIYGGLTLFMVVLFFLTVSANVQL